jgi:hypothetical protein
MRKEVGVVERQTVIDLSRFTFQRTEKSSVLRRGNPGLQAGEEAPPPELSVFALTTSLKVI